MIYKIIKWFFFCVDGQKNKNNCYNDDVLDLQDPTFFNIEKSVRKDVIWVYRWGVAIDHNIIYEIIFN